MKEAVTKVIDTLRQKDFDVAFQKLLERCKKCPYEKSLETYLMILVNDNYFWDIRNINYQKITEKITDK